MQQHAKHQRYKVRSTHRQERDQVSLELMAWVENAVTAAVHLQAAGKDVPAATWHRASQNQGTPASAIPRETRHQPCREPRTVSALIPTSCSCTLGSVSAENTTEQTWARSDSRVLSSGERGTESPPASGCHHTATTTAPDRPFLGPCWLTPSHAGSLGQGTCSRPGQ